MAVLPADTPDELGRPFDPPVWYHKGVLHYVLGTDDQGRDIFSTILFGSRISMLVGVGAMLMAMVIGVALGLISGYAGGALDNFIMRIADITLSCPALLVAMLIDGVVRSLLPDVVAPGTPLGVVAAAVAQRYGLRSDTWVVAGTTDSTAAFIATGARLPGEAVTSLGSTLVLKVISDQPVSAPEYGVYSQPLGSRWLIGGGSNSGGAVLRHYFTDAAMADLSARLQPERGTGLDYYPLPAPGERFPVNDPRMQPRLSPRPDDDAVFFQGLLEGMARIERDGYRRLAALGAPWPSRVYSVGGGAKNAAWNTIRARLLGVPLTPPPHTAAAYGAALLAARTLSTMAAGASAPAAC